MKKVEVYFVCSPLNKMEPQKEEMMDNISRFLKQMTSHVGQFSLVDTGAMLRVPEDVPKTISEDVILIFLVVMSGGTEDTMIEFIKFGLPTFLQTSRFNNSLAAAVEAKQRMMEKIPVFLRHEEDDNLSTMLTNFSEYEDLRKRLQGKWLTIGGASSWLVASDVSIERLRDFGIDLVTIDSSTLSPSKNIDENDELVKKKAMDFLQNADSLIGVKEKDVLITLKSYKLLQDLITKHQVKGLTIRCIDLIMDIETSICLPVSLLNDEGVVTSCEGDLRSLFGMAIGSLVSKMPSFMGNLSHFDRSKKMIIISHCTIPRKLTDSYDLKTHYETKMGVSIHGNIKSREITIFSIDRELKNAVVTKGKMVMTDGDDCLCRTQMHIIISDIEFVEKTYGNHQIVVYADCSKIAQFLEYIGIKAFVYQ